MSQIIILGAGFGGLTIANELQRVIGNKHKIILIDKRNKYYIGLAKLWVMLGKRLPDECQKEISLIEKKGIRFINDEIVNIEPEEKKVYTTTNYYRYDYLVIALGAELAPDLIPGFKEYALNLYDIHGAHAISKEIERFYRGKIVILITRLPFKCPAAPYESAFLLKDFFKKRQMANVSITICTPEQYPLPTAGKDLGDSMTNMLSAYDITFKNSLKVLSIDNQRKLIIFEDGSEERYDLLIGIPPHVPPPVIKRFVNESNWLPVDMKTLKTNINNVYAIGDVAGIRLQNGSMLPKAGIFAEQEAKVVADNIISELEGKKGIMEFDGKGYCFMETGDEECIKINGNFFELPNPKVEITPSTKENYHEKILFEKQRLTEWF